MFEDIEPEISHVLRYAIAVLVFNMTKVYLKFSDLSLKLLNRLGILCFDIFDVSGANRKRCDALLKVNYRSPLTSFRRFLIYRK